MRFALLVALAGCDTVWNIHHLRDAGIDAADAAPAIDGTDCVTIPEAVNADVLLVYAAGNVRDQGHPVEAILNVGVPQSAEALQRFAIPPLDGRTITALHLVEPFVPKGNGCNGDCGNCAALDRTGSFAIAFATSMWDELAACYNKPTASGAWQQPGANGPADRSPIVGQGSYTAMTDLVIDLDATKLGTWVQNDQLSIILTGTSPNGQVVVGQKDFTTNPPPCTPVPAAVTITVTACR